MNQPFYQLHSDFILQIPGNVWVFVKDTDGRYLACNERMAHDLRMSSADLIGRSDYDLFEEHEAEHYRYSDLEVMHDLTTKKFEDTVTLAHFIGKPVAIKSPLFEHEKLKGVVGYSYFADIAHDQRSLVGNLTLKEAELVKHLRQGKSNKAIASVMKISVRTVEFHLHNIKRKLNYRSKSALIEKLLSN